MHPWHFVHLDEDLIDFYEGLGLGFRDDQEDVDGGEKTYQSKNDEAVSSEAHLDEWEDQAHSEVREPVNSTRHHVGSWPGGLQEDLGDEQCGDGTGPKGMPYDVGDDTCDADVRHPGYLVLQNQGTGQHAAGGETDREAQEEQESPPYQFHYENRTDSYQHVDSTCAHRHKLDIVLIHPGAQVNLVCVVVDLEGN